MVDIKMVRGLSERFNLPNSITIDPYLFISLSFEVGIYNI